jgi:hypothetical protein
MLWDENFEYEHIVSGTTPSVSIIWFSDQIKVIHNHPVLHTRGIQVS